MNQPMYKRINDLLAKLPNALTYNEKTIVSEYNLAFGIWEYIMLSNPHPAPTSNHNLF